LAERNFDEEYDYDSQQGHSFVLGGHTFHTRPVASPGAFLSAGGGLMAAVRFLRKLVLEEDRAALERVMEMDDTSASLIDAAPDLYAAAQRVLATEGISDPVRMTQALEKLREAVEKVRQDTEPGPIVSAAQVDEVAKWLMEETIGRPTRSPSSSSNGDGRTSDGSKASSRRPAKAGKT